MASGAWRALAAPAFGQGLLAPTAAAFRQPIRSSLPLLPRAAPVVVTLQPCLQPYSVRGFARASKTPPGPEADEPEEFAVKNFKASKLKKEGKIEEAEQLLRGVVERRETELGADDSFTIAAGNELAELLSEEGKHEEAADYFRKVIAGLEKHNGPEKVLSTKQNLAEELLETGKADIQEAAQMFERVLADLESRFGTEHPTTVACRHNLAAAYRMQGKFREASKVLGTEEEGTFAS